MNVFTVLKQTLAQMRLVWSRMPAGGRVVIAAVLLAALAGVGWLLFWARTPHYRLLYSNLSPEDASKVVEYLDDEGLDYRLGAGGTSVYVADHAVYRVRLGLATKGLPGSSQKGYKIFDEQRLGLSPFVQRVNYNRALEQELARTITVLQPVNFARVHIVRPEPALFEKDRTPATATVVVTLTPAASLTAEQVGAMTHLVAGSVEGLEPKNVVVVDSSGTLLSASGDDGAASTAGTFLEYKCKVETYLATKAEEMLRPILGPGRAVVRVDAEVDFRSTSQTVEDYDPEGRVVTSEEIRSQSASGSGGGPGAQAGGGETSKEETSVSEYAVSRTVQQVTDAAGRVKSLSVAAFVDLTSGQPLEDGSASPGTPAPGTSVQAEATLEDVEEIIKQAIGFQEGRDTFKVVAAAFQEPLGMEGLEAEAESFDRWQFYLGLAKHLSLGLVAVAVVVVLRLVTRSSVEPAAGSAFGLPGTASGNGGEHVEEALRSEITRAVRRNPAEARRLFLGWMGAEED